MKPVVLIVEDDVDASETLREFLEGEGYDVVCASEGARALALALATEHLGLVLLDLHMPGMNGWDFFAAFKSHPCLARVPVIVVTSVPERAPAGAEVLPKPVALMTVLASAARHCPI